MNLKAGFSQRLSCFSVTHPLTHRVWELRLCSQYVMRVRIWDGQMKHLCCWPEKGVSCWLSWGVWGNFLCLADLKSMSEAAGGSCPLGSQRLGSSPQGGRWKHFLRKLTRTDCSSLKMGLAEEDKGTVFLWTNLGVKYLHQMSWGPWADFLPWHMEVHVQIRSSSGESPRAPAARGWRSCRASTSRLKQCWWARGWREKGESLAQPSAWSICLGGRNGLQVPLSARLC